MSGNLRISVEQDALGNTLCRVGPNSCTHRRSLLSQKSEILPWKRAKGGSTGILLSWYCCQNHGEKATQPDSSHQKSAFGVLSYTAQYFIITLGIKTITET